MVWAVKKNRQLFYVIPFIEVSDHQPLKNLETLAAIYNRVQRWYDFLSAYTYKLVYRPGKLHGNADLLSRLPLPAAADKANTKLRQTDPTDIDVYFIGASGVQPRLGGGAGISLGGLEPGLGGKFVEERKHRPAPWTTDETAELSSKMMQNDRKRAQTQTKQPESPRVCATRDNSPVTLPEDSSIVSGHLEPGLIVHECPMPSKDGNF